MDLNDVKLERSPELEANPISKLFFIWLLPLLRKGSRKDLEVTDVYSCRPEDSSERLGDFMQREWNKEKKVSHAQSRPPRLWRVVRKFIWKRYTLVGLGCCVDELGLRVFQPIILKSFIRTFQDSSKENDPNFRRNQFLYAAGLVLISLLHAILYQTIITACIHIGVQVRLGMSALIYRKVLRLRKSDSEDVNAGKLCNLLSSDVGRFDQAFQLLHFFYIAPIQISIYAYLLWSELGPASMAGIAGIIVVLPFQVLVGRFSMYFRTRIARRTDKRGRFLNEIIGGIRLLKMYCWEKPFSSIVSKLRKDEIKFIRRHLYLRGLYICVHVVNWKLQPFCALIAYVALGNTLQADKAFFTVSIFGILQPVLNRIPNGASQYGEMVASLNRIEHFLMSKESKSKPQCSPGSTQEPSVSMENYSASWTETQETLRNLNVNLKGNKLVMVVGHVGSGKSSFLNAILSELPIISSVGSCSVRGRLSYSSQEAWIFPATLRQNILFGLEMDRERYMKVIELCCLVDDMNQFPDWDLTLVGERGVALSGGQKARVNLARALYQEADIYLLDDPLSAVDPNVSRSLFNKCIREHLAAKLCILVTHQVQYLPKADHIIVLNRDGSIWCQGSYTELMKSNVDFTSLFTDQFMNPQTPEEDDDDDKIALNSNGNAAPMIISGKEEVKSRLLTGTALSMRRDKEETRNVGSVGFKTYFRYFKAGGSYAAMVFLVLTFLGSQFLMVAFDFWLSLWTNAVSKSAENSENSSATTSWVPPIEGLSEEQFYTYVYCGLMASLAITIALRCITLFGYCMRISINLHDEMFGSVVRCPVKFFDDNPSGRIMNRFTRDLNHVDENLPISFNDFIAILLMVLGMLVLNVIANYYIIIPSIFLLFGLWRLRRFYLLSARDLKRLESLTKSPMFTHVTMTVQGLTTIRALEAEKRVQGQFERIQDIHTSVWYAVFSSNRLFALWLEMMSVLYLTCVSFGFLLLPSSSQGGSVGVAITSILGLAGTLQWGVRQSAETENYMISVERAIEYCNLKPEAELVAPTDSNIPPGWPSEGRIEFHSVSLAYDDKHEHKVLKEISFTTEASEKLGIVGRTGAGKTSLATVLFRLTEPCGGEILIDSVNTKEIGLHTLRSRIAVICQDPVLFTGTLRYNLDPFDEFTDDELWRVLRDVDLHHAVQSLDCPVSDGGSNFSTGQRQLLSLARAALRGTKILILDEATANVDPATDQLVQKTIREKFSECTIWTIAHRLQSVMDNDRILVLDKGRVAELDSPDVLRQNENSLFSMMLKQSESAEKAEK